MCIVYQWLPRQKFPAMAGRMCGIPDGLFRSVVNGSGGVMAMLLFRPLVGELIGVTFVMVLLEFGGD